jgi:hypothetical protein
MCGRTATIETWCNDDGSRTAVLGNTYIQNLTGQYVPLTEATTFTFKNGKFILNYLNESMQIEPYAIINGTEYNFSVVTSTYATSRFGTIIKKYTNGYEYGLNFSAIPAVVKSKLNSIGFRVTGNTSKFITDFSDVRFPFSLTKQDANTYLVGNVTGLDEVFIDPVITLNESNANIGDTYTDSQSSTTNYGTGTYMWVDGRTGPIYDYAWVKFNLSNVIPSNATITNANLSLYMFVAPTGSRTYQAYNTTSNWTETGLTWATQPAQGTLQGTIATGTTANVWLSWNVTPATIASYNQPYPLQNLSIQISDNTFAVYSAYFASRDNATTASRPQLYITYTLPACTETGLVGYWKFDENTGNYAYDSSGCGGNTGTLAGATWTTGKNYQTPYALSFDGATKYVQTALNINITGSSNRTESAWAYIPAGATTQDAILVNWGDCSGDSKNFGIWARAGYWWANVYSGANDFYLGGVVTTGWQHIAITYDGTNIRGYINGVLTNTSSSMALNAIATQGSIGARNCSGWGSWFNGTIDEVKVWNRTLTATEIWNETWHYCPLSSGSYIIAYNESSPAQAVGFNFIASNTTSTFTYNGVGATYWTDYYCNATFPIGALTISVSNSSFYSPRYYYPTIATGGTLATTAYLLPLNAPYTNYPAISTSFIILSGSLTITTATVTVKKQVNGVWVTVAQGYTDSAGVVPFWLDSTIPYYIITTASGYATRYDYIIPISNIYWLKMQSSASGVIPFWEYFNQYTYACAVDNSSWPASMLINCSVNDSSGHFDNVTLTVQATGYYGSQTLCTNSSSTATFTVSCYLASPPNQTITYQLSVNTHSDPGFYTIATGIIDWFLNPSAKYGTFGIIIAMMITLGLGLIGIFNPALGIVGVAVGLLLSGMVFGLVNIPTAAMMAILTICVILIYRIRT